MEIFNKKILIVGLARTGFALALFFQKKGAIVTVTDIAKEESLKDVSVLRNLGIKLELGGHFIDTFLNSYLIVISPGVCDNILQLKKAKENGVNVLGELEIASRFINEPIIAITGTNGKTTTTELVGKILKNSGLKVFVGGNIGNPLICYVDNNDKADVIVAEVSSFQIDTTKNFKPKIAVLLNITEDHMDRYGSFDLYVKSKAKIFENQQESDIAILNGNDPYIRLISSKIKSRLLFIDPKDSEEGVAIDEVNNVLIFNTKEFIGEKLKLEEINLMGRFNRENIAASCLAALYSGADFETIKRTLKDFKGLPHRIEYVDTVNSVKYFDDSKGTNIDAVYRALEVFTQPVILIMGGRDKGGSFNMLRDRVKKHVKHLIVIGEAKNAIKEALFDMVSTTESNTMHDAVIMADSIAEAGDVVLLSPACASFDMYKNYAERGKDFCKEVLSLKKI